MTEYSQDTIQQNKSSPKKAGTVGNTQSVTELKTKKTASSTTSPSTTQKRSSTAKTASKKKSATKKKKKSKKSKRSPTLHKFFAYLEKNFSLLTLSLIVALLLIAVFLCGIIVGVKIRRSIEEEQNTNDLIQKYATEYDVPYDIVCAVIETESSFQSDAISSTGARGLMQINKITLTDLNQRLGTDYSMDDLFDPAINIRLGTFYLSHLYKRFGNYETVYAAYNAGPTRVAEWLTDSQYSKDGITLIHDNIPYAETKRYVEKVIKNYQARQGS